jgi:hypothetical protein
VGGGVTTGVHHENLSARHDLLNVADDLPTAFSSFLVIIATVKSFQVESMVMM